MKTDLISSAGKAVSVDTMQCDVSRSRKGKLSVDYEHIPIGIVETSLQGKYRNFNKEFCRITGYEREELLERSIEETTYADDYPVEAARLAQLVAGEIPFYKLEKRYLRKDGQIVWVEVTRSLVCDADGKPLYTIAAVLDITERQLARKSLVEAARQQEALYKLADRLHRANSMEDIFDASLDAILHALLCNRASILLFDETRVMRFVAWRGLSDRYREATNGHSPWTEDMECPLPITMDDINTADVSESLKAVITQEGIRSLAFIPLMSGGRLIGKFMVYFNDLHPIQQEEVDISLTIARHLASGIERKHGELSLILARQRAENTAERITRLQKFTAALSNAATFFQAAQTILEEGTRAAGASAGILIDVLENGREIRTVAALGYPPDAVHTKPVPLATAAPMSACVLGKQAIWIGSHQELASQYPPSTTLRDAPSHEATAVLPLIIGERLLGGLAFSFTEAQAFHLEEREFLLAIASRCAQCLDRTRAEDELRSRDAELQAVMNQTPFMFTRCSPDMRYRFVSRAYAEMLGRTPGQVAGQSILEIMGEEGWKTIAPYVERVLAGNRVEYESEIPFPGGITPVLHVVYTPEWDEQGQVIGWFASMNDITPRRRTEEVLLASENLYRTIARSIPGGGVYVVDKNFRYVVAEGTVSEAFGLSRDALEGHTIFEALSAEQSVRMEERLKRTFAGEVVSFETRHNDRVYWTQQAPLRDSLGHAIIVTVDITDRKRVEEALQESEQRYRAILNQATAGIVRKQLDGTLIYVNQAFCQMLGYSSSELAGRSIWEFTHPGDVEGNKRLYGRLMQDGQPFQLEKRLIRRDGSLLWVNASVSPILDEQGTPQSAVAVEVDITDRKQAEEALQQLNLELESLVDRRTAQLQRANQALRYNRRRLVEVQEAERRAIARELHDRVGQSLTALNLNLNIIQDQISGQGDEHLSRRLADSIHLLDTTIPAVRDVMADLRPAVLDDYGLEVALRTHLNEFSARFGIPVDFQKPDAPLPRLVDSLEMTLFRIAQEALFNVAKHAKACTVTLSITWDPSAICLTVQDNGIGMHTGELSGRAGGHGLTIMRERAEAVGGSLNVTSAIGCGSTVMVRLPIQPDPALELSSGGTP